MSHRSNVRTWIIPGHQCTDDQILKYSFSLGLVVGTCNPNYWMQRQEDRVQGQPGKLSETLPQNPKWLELQLSSRTPAQRGRDYAHPSALTKPNQTERTHKTQPTKKPCNPHRQTRLLIPRAWGGVRNTPCSAALVTLLKGPSAASPSFVRSQSRVWALRLAQHLLSPCCPVTCLPVHLPFFTLRTPTSLTGFQPYRQ